MKYVWRIIGILFLITGLCACHKKESLDSVYAPLKDQRLVIYTSHKEEVYGPIIKEFEERTGIWVEVVAGGTNELLERIKKESKDTYCDVMFGGGVENLEAYSSYFLDYEGKESLLIDQTYSSTNHKWTAFSALPIVIIYNNKLVHESVAPSGWNDLLNERWKGKIAFADPYNSGSSYTMLATMMQLNELEPDSTLKEFVSNLDNHILKGSGDVINAVIKGTRLVGITLEETALKRIAKGADLTMVYPKEGTSAVPDGSAIIMGAPNRENAIRFMDFIISEDVQKLIVDQFYRRSVRTDIPLTEVQKEAITLIDYNLEWASSNQDEILEYWSTLTQ